mgnify:CR=1 FL=1
MNKYEILMIGKPGGNLVRTYDWHIEALNNDKKKRYKVDCIHSMTKNVDISKYNIAWFYAKAFQPEMYHTIKKLRPDIKIVFGPNILLDKPDVGPSDDWDKWYIENCKPDLHLDQVSFYSNHVKKFLKEDVKKVAKTLNKCIKIENNLYNPDIKKEYDCLIYSKKRRYDTRFEDFRYDLLLLLEKNNINFCEIPAGKFGSYNRNDYFKLLNKSKVMINLSLDECPGILNYESMFFNVPVIGSPHNVPITSCKDFYVKDTDEMTEKYLVRKKDAAEKYFNKIKDFLDGKINSNINHREWVLKETSFQNYCDRLDLLISEVI